MAKASARDDVNGPFSPRHRICRFESYLLLFTRDVTRDVTSQHCTSNLGQGHDYPCILPCTTQHWSMLMKMHMHLRIHKASCCTARPKCTASPVKRQDVAKPLSQPARTVEDGVMMVQTAPLVPWLVAMGCGSLLIIGNSYVNGDKAKSPLWKRFQVSLQLYEFAGCSSSRSQQVVECALIDASSLSRPVARTPTCW